MDKKMEKLFTEIAGVLEDNGFDVEWVPFNLNDEKINVLGVENNTFFICYVEDLKKMVLYFRIFVLPTFAANVTKILFSTIKNLDSFLTIGPHFNFKYHDGKKTMVFNEEAEKIMEEQTIQAYQNLVQNERAFIELSEKDFYKC